MATTGSPHLQRLPALDGLRGLAALSVVVAHFADHWGALPWTPLGGGMGVLVFFVLSGYLIARLSLRIGGGWDRYRAFVRRRIVRLGPTVAVVSTVVPLFLWFDGLSAQRALEEAVRTATQTTGLAMIFGWEVHPTLGPSWSLTTEWLFYLTFPAGVLFAVRAHSSAQTLARYSLIAAAGLYLAAMPLSHGQFYATPVANVGVMCVGAALAFGHQAGWTGPELISRGPGPYAGLAMVLIFVLLPGDGASWGYRLSVLPATTAAAAVMIHGVHHGHPVTKLLAWQPFALVGVRAYSLYLWHLPVMWLVWRLVGGQGVGVMVLLGVPLIATVTMASFAILERPVLYPRTRPQESVAVTA
jgi:peptidoglycan/LPS O-acetylase OafA/YrhL